MKTAPMTESSPDLTGVPASIIEFSTQAVAYVERSVGVPPTFDSETLPLVDHYLKSAKNDQAETVALVAATCGAYFGEVVRRALGGSWNEEGNVPSLVLPGGLTIVPMQIAQAVIIEEGVDSEQTSGSFLSAPAAMRPHLEETLSRMGEISQSEYYSLAGQYDILEHLQDVLLAIAAKLQEEAEKTVH